MGECDGVGAVHREVAVSRGVYSARVAAQAALGSRGVFPNPSLIRLRKSCPSSGGNPGKWHNFPNRTSGELVVIPLVR
jgi:hypothetical protein